MPNSTRLPGLSAGTPAGSADECTKTSPPSSRDRKPKPLSVSYHLTLPVGTGDLLIVVGGMRTPRGAARPSRIARGRRGFPARSSAVALGSGSSSFIAPDRKPRGSTSTSAKPAVAYRVEHRLARPRRPRPPPRSTSSRARLAEVAHPQVARPRCPLRPALPGRLPRPARPAPAGPGVISMPNATRLDRQAAAGLSQVARPQAAAGRPDLRLGQPRVEQRGDRGPLGGGPDARAGSRRGVVGVGAGGDVRRCRARRRAAPSTSSSSALQK